MRTNCIDIFIFCYNCMIGLIFFILSNIYVDYLMVFSDYLAVELVTFSSLCTFLENKVNYAPGLLEVPCCEKVERWLAAEKL